MTSLREPLGLGGHSKSLIVSSFGEGTETHRDDVNLAKMYT